jgi:hypothetical protein
MTASGPVALLLTLAMVLIERDVIVAQKPQPRDGGASKACSAPIAMAESYWTVTCPQRHATVASAALGSDVHQTVHSMKRSG